MCGHLPCTCPGGNRKTIEVRLGQDRLLCLHTTWEEKVFFCDKFVSLKEYVQILFGKIPTFFSGPDDLKEKWANPETREQLLATLDEAGFEIDKLNRLKTLLSMERCDLLDVLEYIAYNSTPIERAMRVEVVKRQYVDLLEQEQRDFDYLILQYYANNGFRELSLDKLRVFINIKFNNSMSDAKAKLKMSPAEMRAHYIELQKRLYYA